MTTISNVFIQVMPITDLGHFGIYFLAKPSGHWQNHASMKTSIIIPARAGSSRFPGKPLAEILGKKLLHRTWQIAKKVKQVDDVYIATDSPQIQKVAIQFGATVILTRPDCRNGTERTFEALCQISDQPDIIINLQGDAVLTPPWVIQAIVQAMQENSTIQVATPATHLNSQQFEAFLASKSQGRASGTLVVFDLFGNALYFSKSTIPFIRNSAVSQLPIYRHIGLYGYRIKSLKEYNKLEPTPLENVEQLEQLRFLENGIPIRIIPVDYQGRTHWSIDNPEDIKIVENIILKEGELVE